MSGHNEVAARLFLPIAQPATRRSFPVDISVERGLYDRPRQVHLATKSPPAVIRYTVDGSTPTRAHGATYRGPIAIGRTTVLRAVAFEANLAPSPVATATYIFPADVARQSASPAGLPTYWGTYIDGPRAGQPISTDYEMDARVVADPRYAARLSDALRAIATVSVVTDPAGLFGPEAGIYAHPWGRGLDWERRASVELIDPQGGEEFQIDCGLRISGQTSRNPYATPKKSFSLRFTSRHGPRKLKADVFPGSPVRTFDTLKLRAGLNDSFAYVPGRALYVRDAWGRESQLAMDALAPRGRFVHLYLNGLYWGVYQLTEEPTASFMARHLGGSRYDYDVVEALRDGDGVEDGDRRAYEELIEIDGLSDREQFEQVERRLDIAKHADYVLLNLYAGNTDWPGGGNWRAGRRREPPGEFVFFAWDMEAALDLLPPGHISFRPNRHLDIADSAGVDGLHARLTENPEYRLLFADRAHLHLLDGGALSATAAATRFSTLTERVRPAIIAETARWGDAGPTAMARAHAEEAWASYRRREGEGHPQTLDDEWLPERDRLLAEFFPRRSREVLKQLCREGLYPPVVAPRLTVRPLSTGRGASLVMRTGDESCPGATRGGPIYYTTDGRDPRERWTSDRSESARQYTEPLVLLRYAHVKARAYSQGRWSALVEAKAGVPRLAVTELHYHPAEDSDGEFLELTNLEPVAVDLSGLSFTGVSYTFPPGETIRPGEHVLLARDAEALVAATSEASVVGEFRGHLANEGEALALRAPDGSEVLAFAYDDEGHWPLSPDGGGYSLVLRDAERAFDDPENWRASAELGGSPGSADPPLPAADVVINEVLAHAEPPLERAIELHNRGPHTLDIGGWLLSDARDALSGFLVGAGTTLQPYGFVTIYESEISHAGGQVTLDASGGEVFISSMDAEGRKTSVLYGAGYHAAEANAPAGRLRSCSGPRFEVLQHQTFGVDDPATVAQFRLGHGAPNAPVRVGPLVLNELQYHPPPGDDEYVELHNIGPQAVELHPVGEGPGAWSLSEGVRFAFPPGSMVPSGGYAVVTQGDPGEFRRRHGVPTEVPVLGPFAGRLDNSGECVAVAVQAPVAGSPGSVIRVARDRVCYERVEPWPVAADGSGASLERIFAGLLGDVPTNWSALRPGGTPGKANVNLEFVFLPHVILGE